MATKKWWFASVSAAALLIILAFVLTANGPARDCLDFYQARARAQLKLISSEQQADATWITVVAGPDEVRSTAVCKFNVDGKVDPTSTEAVWLGKLVDETTTCLKDAESLWNEREGRYNGRPRNCGEEAVSRRLGWLRLFADGDLDAAFGHR